MEQKFNLYEKIQFLLEDKAENLLNILLQNNTQNREMIGNYCSENHELNNIGDYLLDRDYESSWIEILIGKESMPLVNSLLNSIYKDIHSEIHLELNTNSPNEIFHSSIEILTTEETITISIEI